MLPSFLWFSNVPLYDNFAVSQQPFSVLFDKHALQPFCFSRSFSSCLLFDVLVLLVIVFDDASFNQYKQVHKFFFSSYFVFVVACLKVVLEILCCHISMLLCPSTHLYHLYVFFFCFSCIDMLFLDLNSKISYMKVIKSTKNLGTLVEQLVNEQKMNIFFYFKECSHVFTFDRLFWRSILMTLNLVKNIINANKIWNYNISKNQKDTILFSWLLYCHPSLTKWRRQPKFKVIL